MKLTELVERWDLMEMFGTRMPITWSQTNTHGVPTRSGTFTIGGDVFNITIGEYDIALENKPSATAYELSFRRVLPTGDTTTKLTPSSAPASKIFGVCFNAWADIIKREHPDVVLFSAKRANDPDQKTFDTRVRIYTELAHRFSKVMNGAALDVIENDRGKHFFIIGNNIEYTLTDKQNLQQL